jgi:hypothetical protein
MQPQSPNPQFDFMLKDSPAPKKSLMPSIPKPAKIILLAVAVIFVLVIAYAIFAGRGGGSTQDIVSVIARQQETLRVTNLAQSQLQLQDPQTQALAATVTAAISSDQKQLTDYLTASKTKLSTAQLASATDKNTDSLLQTASRNNNLDSAYVNYLKSALTKYQSDLQTAFKSAGPNGKVLLQQAFESANTLLTTAPLKS